MFPTREPAGEHHRPGEVRGGADDDDLLGDRADEARFTALFRSTYEPVRRYLQRMVGLAEADDVTADVFATVWSRWSAAPGSPLEPERDRAWVFGFAHHKVQEAARARDRRAGLLSRVVQRRVESSVPGPEEDVVAFARTREVLALLPPAERDAVALTVLGGLTSAEAARVLGVSVSAVTTRVSRARQRLRDTLPLEEVSTDG